MPQQLRKQTSFARLPFLPQDLHSVQFSSVSMRLEKPICAPPRLNVRSFPNVAFEYLGIREVRLGSTAIVPVAVLPRYAAAALLS